MDLWQAIQISLILFFVLIPVFIVVFFLWIKRIVDDNRDMSRKELEVLSSGDNGGGQCDVCGGTLHEDFRFCPMCHKKLGNQCPQCGEFLHVKWTLCPYCGKEYTVETVKEDEAQKPLLHA